MRKLSPTSHLKKLPKYGGCPRRTWYDMHGAKNGVERNRTDKEGAEIGQLTHAVLERWLRKVARNGVDVEIDARAEASKILTSSMHDCGIGERTDALRSALRYVEVGQRMIRDLRDFRLTFDPELALFVPHALRNGDRVMIKGIMDLVFTHVDERTGKTRLAIGDFKTGRSEYEDELGRPQFTTYAWMFDRLYGTEAFQHVPLVREIIIFFLKEDKRWTIRVDDEFTSRVEDDVEEWLRFSTLSENKDDYERVESGLCRSWCDWSRDCVGYVMGKRTRSTRT